MTEWSGRGGGEQVVTSGVWLPKKNETVLASVNYTTAPKMPALLRVANKK